MTVDDLKRVLPDPPEGYRNTGARRGVNRIQESLLNWPIQVDPPRVVGIILNLGYVNEHRHFDVLLFHGFKRRERVLSTTGLAVPVAG